MPGLSRNRPHLMISRGLAERNDVYVVTFKIVKIVGTPLFPGAYAGRAIRCLAEFLPRSGHLGHTQVCDRQLEVALVEYLCVCFLAARGSDPV